MKWGGNLPLRREREQISSPPSTATPGDPRVLAVEGEKEIVPAPRHGAGLFNPITNLNGESCAGKMAEVKNKKGPAGRSQAEPFRGQGDWHSLGRGVSNCNTNYSDLHRRRLTTTVPDNGDQNPYAIVVAPVSAGKIQKDDVLVDNFNDREQSAGPRHHDRRLQSDDRRS